MSAEMVIAKCPSCGQQYHAWSEDDAREKFKRHRCTYTLLEREIKEILDRVLNEDWE